MARHRAHDGSGGFTLVEVVVALLLMATAAAAVLHLTTVSARDILSARVQTTATVLAAQKLEQLRALTWMSVAGVPMSDLATDLSRVPPAEGGAGLGPSPADSLLVNTPGWVDYLDRNGRWVGTGASVPASAAFVRRWNLLPLAGDPSDTLVAKVLVRVRGSQEGGIDVEALGKASGTLLMATVITREAR